MLNYRILKKETSSRFKMKFNLANILSILACVFVLTATIATIVTS